jgi:hypothetical protein
MLKTLAAALIATAMIAGPALAAQGTTGQAPGAEPKVHKTHHMRHHMRHHAMKHKHHHMAKAKAPKADK